MTTGRSYATVVCPAPANDVFNDSRVTCKYAGVRVETSCTARHAAEKICYKRRIDRFARRGGTASAMAPGETTCTFGDPENGFDQWQLDWFAIFDTDTGTSVYTASAAHYAVQRNCGVEKQLFYGLPSNLRLRKSAEAFFSFDHHCASPVCGSFNTDLFWKIKVG